MNTYFSIQKQHFMEIPKKFSKVFKFNIIEAHKLLEIGQYCILTFFITLICSTAINRFIISDRIKLRSINTPDLILKISGYTLIIAVFARYIPKLVSVIPFFGHFSKKYKSNFKGEANTGITISMGLAFYTVIYNYYALVEEITYRLFPKSQKLTGPATQMCQMPDNNYVQAHPSCDTIKLKHVYHDID